MPTQPCARCAPATAAWTGFAATQSTWGRRRWLALSLVWLLFTVTPGAAADAPPPRPGGCAGTEMLAFEGRVVWLDFEGGFWGILAADGRRYDPQGLPAGFRRAGLRVRVVARIVPGMAGSHMWGTVVQLVDIVALTDPDGAPEGAHSRD